MKNLLNNYKLLFLLFVGTMTISCNDNDDAPALNPELGTIAEIAIDSPDLSNLVAALGAADGDLVTTLFTQTDICLCICRYTLNQI